MGFMSGARTTTVADYQEEINKLRGEVESMKTFMELIPAHESFNASNVFEIYQSWRDSGMLAHFIRKVKGC